MIDQVRVRIELDNGEHRMIAVSRNFAGSLVAELAAHGLPLNTRCGGRGLCRGCEVGLLDGAVTVDRNAVTAPAIVQACQLSLTGDVIVNLPARSRLEHRPQVGETFEITVPYAHLPLFTPVAGKQDTAFAVDVGTTTVVVLLVDLATGDVLSRAGAFNEQIRFGDNVVTRIDAAREPGNLAAMQRAVVMETIQPLLVLACERAGRSMARIAGGVIAGNTTMLHLLCGVDPTPLGIAPFTPRFIEGRMVTAGEVMLAADGLAPETPLQLLPGIGAYIGADILAGIVASGMVFDSTPSLLVDIGTNGEIVLQQGGRLTACATAAGPAFEGCGLSCGTRARHGALSSLRFNSDPFDLITTTIGDLPLARATGICGSAYVDFLASARRGGLLHENGRFVNSVWDSLPAANRLADDGRRALRLADSNGSGALCVSEVDVALLLQAKAAIGAGIEILLDAAGIRAGDLGRIYLAGGFGMHLDVAHAIAIGLLPGCQAEQVRVVGNTALAGALLVLVDRTTLEEMERLRTQVAVVELNLVAGFEDHYTEHLLLP